jgi:hypothetical protein
MSNQYGLEMEDLMVKFESVSCSKSHLKKLLEKESFIIWSTIDDLGLNNVDSPEYEHLLKMKGQEEVDRRRTFLQL